MRDVDTNPLVRNQEQTDLRVPFRPKKEKEIAKRQLKPKGINNLKVVLSFYRKESPG